MVQINLPPPIDASRFADGSVLADQLSRPDVQRNIQESLASMITQTALVASILRQPAIDHLSTVGIKRVRIHDESGKRPPHKRIMITPEEGTSVPLDSLFAFSFDIPPSDQELNHSLTVVTNDSALKLGPSYTRGIVVASQNLRRTMRQRIRQLPDKAPTDIVPDRIDLIESSEMKGLTGVPQTFTEKTIIEMKPRRGFTASEPDDSMSHVLFSSSVMISPAASRQGTYHTSELRPNGVHRGDPRLLARRLMRSAQIVETLLTQYGQIPEESALRNFEAIFTKPD